MKIKYISLILLTSLFFSCKDFLVEAPTTELSGDQIYSSQSTTLSVLNGCYSILASYDFYNYRFYYLTESSSGLFTSVKNNPADITVTSMLIPTNDLGTEKVFYSNYRAISVANDIIYNLSKPENKLDSTFKVKVKGEASFIRALCYFNLVRLYGGVSLITKPEVDADGIRITSTPRSSASTIYNQILTDLKSSFLGLPENGLELKGRPNRYASKALMAKVYATMATCDSITSPLKASYWDSAYVKAKEVVYTDAAGVNLRNAFTLVKPYAALFDVKNKNSSESIFEIQSSSLDGGIMLSQLTLPSGISLMPNAVGGTQWAKIRPNKETYDLISTTYPNDPRLEASLISSYSKTTDPTKSTKVYPTVGTSTDSEYPYLKKYVDPGYASSSNCNFVVYRYADLLLILAEAANELGKTAEAVKYVNMVLLRARDKNGDGISTASEPSPANWLPSLSQSDFRTKIMYERIIELAGEGEDWFTTHRRKDFFKLIVDNHNTKLNSISMDPDLQATFPARFIFYYPSDQLSLDRNLHLPYPATEIANNEVIGQNDQNYGYK
jgi:hypothetical protein